MSPLVRATGARAHTSPPRLRTLLVVGTVSTGMGLLLAACSGAPNSGGGTSAGAGAGGVPAPAQHRMAVQAAPSAPGLPDKFAGQTRLILSTQSIIYTASLVLRVKDVTVTTAQATAIVAAVGGYVSNEQEIIPRGGHGTPQVIIEFKIPVTQYHPTLAKLATLGRQLFFSQHAQDVTQQVADVGSRVASAQAAIKQLRALLSRAGSISALLSVQDEINAQESALESLLAQQQALAHATSYGTVSVTLLGHHAVFVKKHKKKAHGFVAGLRAGWHALVLVVGWVLTALGAILPFAIPLALLGGIGYAGRRRLGRRTTPPAAEPPATAGS